MRKSDVLGRKLSSWGHLKIPRFHKNRERCGSTPRFLSTSWDTFVMGSTTLKLQSIRQFRSTSDLSALKKKNLGICECRECLSKKKSLAKLPRNSCVEEKTANFVRYSHSCKVCWCFCCCDFLRCLCQHETDLWLYGWLIESPDLVALFYDWSTYPPNVQ